MGSWTKLHNFPFTNTRLLTSVGLNPSYFPSVLAYMDSFDSHVTSTATLQPYLLIITIFVHVRSHEQLNYAFYATKATPIHFYMRVLPQLKKKLIYYCAKLHHKNVPYERRAMNTRDEITTEKTISRKHGVRLPDMSGHIKNTARDIKKWFFSSVSSLVVIVDIIPAVVKLKCRRHTQFSVPLSIWLSLAVNFFSRIILCFR